jgi:hypothetical protein
VSWNVTIRPKARADLRRAHDWYEERCAGLGDDFSPTTPKPSCVWKPIPSVSRFTIMVFAVSSRTAFPTKSFSASSVGKSSSSASCTAHKTTRTNFAGEIQPL